MIGVLGFGAAALLLLLVPFLDRRAARDEPSPLFTVLGIGGLIYLVVFTIVGHFAS
jgi:quinol-cytochrome oxidoreductase complex cytochrome b subunit